MKDLIEEFQLTPQQVTTLSGKLIDNITTSFISELKKNVQKGLSNGQENYLKGLSVERIDNQTREIVLKGFLPNAIEEGKAAYDMKIGFEQSPKVKYGKKGWYLTIPFRFSQNPKNHETKLPKEIATIVKSQKIPLNSSQIPESILAKERKELLSKNKPYTPKSSIYEGIQKNASGEMNSFRRVGASSDQDSFIHPGFKAHNFFNLALIDLEPSIPIISESIIDQFLIDIG